MRDADATDHYPVARTPLPALPPEGTPSAGPPAARLVVYCVVAASLVLGAIIGLFSQIENLVLDRIRGAAAQHGLLVNWEHASVSPALDVTLTGATVRGAQLEASAAKVQASLDWASLTQSTTFETLTVEGFDATLDVRARGTGGTQLGGSSASRALGVVRADGTLRVRVQDRPEVALERLSVFGKPSGDAWQATVVADCTAGCGAEATRVDASVVRTGGNWRASAQLERPVSLMQLIVSDDAPLTGPFEKLKDVTARHFEVSLVEGEPQLAARRIQGALALAGWDGRFEVDRASMGRDGIVQLNRPRVSVGRRRTLDASEGSGSRWRGLLTDPHAVSDVLDQVTTLLEQVHVERGSFALEGIATLDDVDASARGGNAVVSGNIGGGAVRLFFGVHDDEIRVETNHVGIRGLTRRSQFFANAGVDGHASGVFSVRPSLMAPSAPKALRGRSDSPVSLGWRSKGAIKLRALQAHFPKVAAQRFDEVDLDVGFDLQYVPSDAPGEEDRFIVRAADARFPEGPTVRLRGEARNVLQPAAGPVAFALELDTDETDCQTAFRALPHAALPHLREHIRATGKFAPGVSLSVDLARPYDADVQVRGLPGTCQITSLGPYSPDVLNDDGYRKEVTEGVSKEGIFVGPGSERYVGLGSIPRHVAASAYLSEEILFHSNPGFAMGLMRKALRLNLDKGRYVYGGSSVSQQLVKNLFLSRRKTLARKFEEALIVWRMEKVVSKRRILELYLNCIEFGPDLYGIGRASWAYFGKPVSRLTPLEGAFLAALKPAPWLGARYRRRGKTPAKGWWPKRLESLMKRLAERGHITEDEYVAAAPYVVDTFR